MAATAHSLPPGPRRPAFVQTIEWLLDPEGFMRRCARRYGEAFTVRLGPSADVVFLSGPSAVQAVFRGPPEQMRMGDINGLFRRVLGHNSLLVLDGEEHLRLRRLLLPPFHGDHVADHRQAMSEAAERHVATWPAGTPFALQPSMQAMTLDVILHVVFGLAPGPRRDRLRKLLARLLELNATLATVLPQLRVDLGGRSPWGRLMRCTAAVDEALYAEIGRRRAASPGDNGDVLSVLLEARDTDGAPMPDRELRDQLLTMLVAGHETTATALAWAFERLVRHPAAMARLREELAAGATAYLDAVIKETLRVRPVVPIVGRKLTADVELDGRRFPAGTVLMPCVFLVHRNPAVYEEPTAFRPERFLEGQPPSYAWIPFGGGVRRCIGARFALVEMQAVMRAVLERVDLVPASGRDERVVRRAFTLSPANGARVVVTRRCADGGRRVA
jgi:cytochrome P450 family 135